MKAYNTLKEMRDDPTVPAEVLTEVENLIHNMDAEGGPPDSGDPSNGDNFEYNLGGNIYIAETVDDLKKIAISAEPSKLPDGHPDKDPDAGGWMSIHEGHTSTDDAHYLPGRNFGVIWTGWNNTGGPTYYIPRAVYEAAPNNNFDKIVQDTRTFWNDGREEEYGIERDPDD